MNQLAIEDLVEQIFIAGQITHQDREQIKTALLDEAISDEELSLIEGVIEGIRAGQLKMVP